MKMISIIIPALNEYDYIGRTLETVGRAQGVEVIVVDGGSSDGTMDMARSHSARVISSQKGRAIQMNSGAAEAGGDLLMFLHADCLPPENFASIVRDTLSNSSVIAGAFNIQIDKPGLSYGAIETMANLRSRLTRVPYGDQGFFIGRETFEQIGGFSDIPLMEDIEIGRRVKKLGHIKFTSDPITVSSRRWDTEGIIYTTLRNWTLALAYTIFRVSPARLAGYYKDKRQ